MKTSDSRIRKVVLPLTTILVFAWFFRLFGLRDDVVSLFYTPAKPPLALLPPTSAAQSAFFEQAMSVEFPEPIDYGPIREVCAHASQRPGLIFTCEEQHGGIGMVRNQILKCVRYAIMAGAALVVPRMQLRNAADIVDIETAHEVPLDHMLDRRAFIQHLARGCPGFLLYDRVEDFPYYHQRWQPSPEVLDALRAPPEASADASEALVGSVNLDGSLAMAGDQFEPGRQPGQPLALLADWRLNFDDWLLQNVGFLGLVDTEAHPVHVRVGQSFLEYPVHADGEPFVREFGKILSFREDARALAARVLWALNERLTEEKRASGEIRGEIGGPGGQKSRDAGFPAQAQALDPSAAISSSFGYYGAHLRLEADAIAAWPPEEWRYSRMSEQFDAQYRNWQRTGNLSIVYVASGNDTVVDMFSDYLKQRIDEEAEEAEAEAELQAEAEQYEEEEDEQEEEEEEDWDWDATPRRRRREERQKRKRSNKKRSMAKPKVAVLTKRDLLPEDSPDRRLLDSLTFDQQALVDFLVLFKASVFMGVAHSSFPWTVALRRHELSRYDAYANEGSDLLRDELSVIMGMARDYPYVDPFISGIWP